MIIRNLFLIFVGYKVSGTLVKFFAKCSLLSVMMSASDTFAISSFYKKKAEGWFWYNDPIIENYEIEKDNQIKDKKTKENNIKEKEIMLKEKQEIKGSKMQVPKNLTPESARAFKEEFQRKLDDAKNMWLFSGDFKHAAEYLRMQKRVMDFASHGAQVAATAKRIYPDLNDEIENPTSQTARLLFEEQKKKVEDRMITEYAKEFHLVYFTDPESEACKIFAGTIAEFAKLYGFKVFAQEVYKKPDTLKSMQNLANGKYRKDGKDDKLFEIINDQILLASVAPKHFPALVAIDPETREWQPIAYHMPNFYELRKLVLETIKDIILKINGEIK